MYVIFKFKLTITWLYFVWNVIISTAPKREDEVGSLAAYVIVF